MATNRTLFVATAVLLLGFGGAFLLIPWQIFPLYGVELSPPALMLARVAGAAVIGLGASAWLFRDVSVAGGRPAHQGLAVFFLIKSIVTLMALLAGVFNLWGWMILAIDIPFFAMHAGAGLGSPRTEHERSAPS